MRTFFISIALIGSLLLPGACAKQQAPKTAQIIAQLEYPVENWRPTTITVAAGGTVTWMNQGDIAHSVVSGEGLWPDKKLNPGESFSYTFPKAGTYTYNDDPPTPVGVGTIYVE